MAILDFLYRGEANVFQDNIDSFLAVAEELQMKGLMGKTEDKLTDFGENERPSYCSSENYPNNSSMRRMPSKESRNSPQGTSALAIPPNLSGNFVELEEKVNSLLEKSQNKTADVKQSAYRYTLYGKEGHGINIKYHIEANHLQGVVIPCNFCGKMMPKQYCILLIKLVLKLQPLIQPERGRILLLTLFLKLHAKGATFCYSIVHVSCIC